MTDEAVKEAMDALYERAEDTPRIINSVPVVRYLRTTLNMLRMAEAYEERGAIVQAYILYVRFSLMWLDKIRKHRDFGNKEVSKQRGLLNIEAKRVITQLEEGFRDRVRDEIRRQIEEEKAKDDAGVPPPPGETPDAQGKKKSLRWAEDLEDVYVFGGLKNVVFYEDMMRDFLRLAEAKTKKGMETMGILAGTLDNDVFACTGLLLPKQTSTENQCDTMAEEEIMAWLDEHKMISLGWIHTHPTQTCFMSSIDVHSQMLYQTMLPEAIGIVMAPKYKPNYGIFHLTQPGLEYIQKCEKRGFHQHEMDVYEVARHVKLQPGGSDRYRVDDIR